MRWEKGEQTGRPQTLVHVRVRFLKPFLAFLDSATKFTVLPPLLVSLYSYRMMIGVLYLRRQRADCWGKEKVSESGWGRSSWGGLDLPPQ